MDPTQYQVWQHAASRELWAVRVELETLTGVSGPLPNGVPTLAELPELLYEEHPDDLEWIVRSCESFTVVPPRPR